MKPRLFDGTKWIEFETQEQHDSYVKTISPTPNLSGYLKNQEHEILGKEVVKELFITLRKQNLTQAQEGDLLNRVINVLNCLSHGFIRGARVVCNNTPVAGQLTQVRKDYLLLKIDEAITKL